MRKIYRNLNVTVVLLLLCCFATQAQEATIQGTIKDETGSPIPGANVIIKGTTLGTTSDESGAFFINASGSDILVISFIGYKSQEITVGNQTSLDIRLETDLTTLDEVVVVGYGEQKRATLTGSVSVVGGSEIVQSPATNVSNSLAGRLPGLTAVNTSSEPGNDGAILRIRGVSTFGNADPLIVVDGIPNRSLDRIDPATIESISVLKDASAAIYGAQAANGVILITTKRGKPGKPTVTASFNQGFGRPTRIPEMANAAEYVTLLNEISAYQGNEPEYTNEEIQKFRDGSDPWRYPDTDWFKETLKPWSGQTYANVSLNGGSESMRYFVSASHRTQDGFYYNSGTKYNQYDFRTNLDGDIGKYVTLGIGLLGRMEDRNYPMRGVGSIFRMVMRGKPNLPAYWPNGLPGPDIEYGDNPVVVSTKATGYDHNKTYALNTNFKLTIKVPWIEGLSVTGNAAIDKGYNFRKRWATPWYLYTWDETTVDADGNPVVERSMKGYDAPRLNQDFEDNQNILLNTLLNYETTMADVHSINFLVGVERIKSKMESFSAGRWNFPSTSLDQLFAGALDEHLSNYGTASNSARLNYFGRVNYSFRDKLLAEFVWRYQGSYIFEKSSRFGFFPGISLGYVLSEEDFWKENVSAVNYFKLRGSWGQTGNDLIDPYQFLSVYNVPVTYNNADPLSFNDGTALHLALQETLLSNRNTSWEVATQRNIGIDMDLFGSKLSLVADYFFNLRDDILWDRDASVPATAGVNLPRENIGKTKNNGFDFSLDYRNSVSKVSYQVGINGGYARNEILFWDEPPGAPPYQRSTGAPINANKYYNAIGIFRDQAHVDSYPNLDAKPGDVIFEDVNGDGVIDGNDMVRSDRTNIPRWIGGLSLGLRFGGFDFSALFQGAAGAQTYIQTESGTIGNFLKSFYDERWTEARPSSTTPRTFDRGAEYWASLPNTYWIHDTDYVRLKNIELGYSLPAQLISRLHIQRARIYVNAYNLLTYSPDMKDFDPEMTTDIENQSSNGQGYPLQKIINTGLSLTF